MGNVLRDDDSRFMAKFDPGLLIMASSNTSVTPQQFAC